MSVRKTYLARALHTFLSLNEVLQQLTEEEVLAALQLESATLRRQSVINRLISRAGRIRELAYISQLKETFHGTPAIKSSLRG